jgi:heptosyltransferase-2
MVDSRISFLASRTVREVLQPCPFNDDWIDSTDRGRISIGIDLRRHAFSTAVLLKNSFSSGLGAILSGAKRRIGYARDCRTLLLTDRLTPIHDEKGKLKPIGMIDYYLRIAEYLGCEIPDRSLELPVAEEDVRGVSAKLPSVMGGSQKVVVLVAGGSFGPSKIWPADRFAAIARRIVDSCDATVVVSVAPNETERSIAREICRLSERKLVNLGESPLTLGELKALFAEADLVVCNDTGPRHIATALGRKVITLFGPNNPVWTTTNYDREIQIVGAADCAPCDKPRCTQTQRICMEAISVDQVWNAVEKMLEKDTT